MQTIARNASLAELHGLLSVQHDAKHDAVVDARKLHYSGGNLFASGMGLDGPAGGAGIFRPTEIFDAHMADALKIPLPYMRRMREERTDLLDANVNGWLHRDDRRFYVRTFLDHRGTNQGLSTADGIARALLSNRYKRVDNLDVITAVLRGVQATGIRAEVSSCQLSDRRMQVHVVAPDIAVYAPTWLHGYRDPFEGPARAQRRREFSERIGYDIEVFGDAPVVFAGFVITNSETGNGAASIWPKVTILRCLNGQTFAKDVLRNVHLGAALDEGVVKHSDATHQKNLELITSMTTDAVTTFLDKNYVEAKVAEIEAKAGVPIDNPQETVQLVGAQLKFTEAQIAGIFNHFIRGGQVTAGGVGQAVTSFAQTVDDPDEAWDLELQALTALEAAATAAR